MLECNLAIKPQDYKNAHAYLRRKNEHCKLSFPTVLMRRNGKVVGIFGTNPSKQAVVAGPLFVDNKFLIIPIVDAYELVLRMGSVTRYLFKVKKTKEDWINAIDRTDGFKKHGEIDDSVIYERFLV